MRRLLRVAIILHLSLAAAPVDAAPWVRSFVVTLYEPAFHYAGPADAEAAPGSDCPRGTMPDNDYRRMLKTRWRSDAEIESLDQTAAPSIEPYRLLAPALHFRGFAPDIDTYINPFAAADPGLVQVLGNTAEGFDLDGTAETGGFVSPWGTPGIDNALYRALGCLMAFRGPEGQGALSQRANTRMRDGLFTMLIRLSGTGAPMQDGAVTVEIGNSPDALVRNPAGSPLRDYSYRFDRRAQYTRMIGRMRNRVLTAGPITNLKAPDFAWSESNRGEAVFRQGKLQLTVGPDGNAIGLIGGYRDWRELYAKMAFNVAVEGPFLEIPYHANLVGIYYALARNADSDPDARGRRRGISTAYRLAAIPAFAVDTPDLPARGGVAPSSRIVHEREAFRLADRGRRITPSP